LGWTAAHVYDLEQFKRGIRWMRELWKPLTDDEGWDE
jgi:hypothetical protein